ncbi:hypothetical protein ACOSQ4_021653 [Xanthoceras sorbifolium]
MGSWLLTIFEESQYEYYQTCMLVLLPSSLVANLEDCKVACSAKIEKLISSLERSKYFWSVFDFILFPFVICWETVYILTDVNILGLHIFSTKSVSCFIFFESPYLVVEESDLILQTGKIFVC